MPSFIAQGRENQKFLWSNRLFDIIRCCQHLDAFVFHAVADSKGKSNLPKPWEKNSVITTLRYLHGTAKTDVFLN